MQDTSTVANSYFIYFTSYATAVLNCTKELIVKFLTNNSYCEMRYYIKEDDLFENSLEIPIDKGMLLCYFDEGDICDACYLFFENANDANTYIKLCNRFFDYCSVSKKWKLLSNTIICFDKDGEKYLGFFSHR